MIVSCKGVWDQDRGATNHGKFADRGSAAARDHEVCRRYPCRKIAEERREIGPNVHGRVGRADLFHVLRAALLHNFQPAPQQFRQERDRRGNQFR